MSTAPTRKKIIRLDGFRVRILYLTRVDVRAIARAYLNTVTIARRNDFTVEQWKTTRFRTSFPGFEVDVMDRRGNSVQGNMKLGTVRDTYLTKK